MSRRVLVVEDDAGYQELMALLLKDFEITACASMEEAQSALQGKPFDLIISDINLLGMSGLEFVAQAKREGLTERVPFILCTSMSDPQTRQRAIDAGAAAFLLKPFEAEQLRTIVRNLLPS